MTFFVLLTYTEQVYSSSKKCYILWNVNLSISFAVLEHAQHTSTNETEVCVRSYNKDANDKGIIKVDYMVIGGTW